MRGSLRDLIGTARRQPAFALYLLALATLGFKWLSPLPSFYGRAIWADVFLAASAALWLLDLARKGGPPRIRPFHVALGLYLGAALLSTVFASDQDTAAKNVLLTLELCLMALLTSGFASDPKRISAIALVISIVVLYTALLAVVGLGLFYAGIDTTLIGSYGEQFVASDRYARVAAGFASPPLLASFCIFASAVVAREDVKLPRRLRLTTQLLLVAIVILTLSRAVIGFVAALAIRAAYSRLNSRPRRLRVVVVAIVVAAVSLIGALSVGRLHLEPTRPSTISYEVPDPHNRREAFVTSLATLGDSPLVGKGPGSFPGENRGAPFRAHFTPLNIAATMGLLALGAAVFLIVVLWRNRKRPTPIATWSGLVGLAIDGMAQDIEHFRHVWVMIGLADADRRPEKAKQVAGDAKGGDSPDNDKN